MSHHSASEHAGASQHARRQRELLIKLHQAANPASPAISPVNRDLDAAVPPQTAAGAWDTPADRRSTHPSSVPHPADMLATPAVARRLDLSAPSPQAPTTRGGGVPRVPRLPPQPEGLGKRPSTPPRGRGAFRGRRLTAVSPGTDRVLRKSATSRAQRPLAPPTAPCNASPSEAGPLADSDAFSPTHSDCEGATPPSSSPAHAFTVKTVLSPADGPDRSPVMAEPPSSPASSDLEGSGSMGSSGMSGLMSTAGSGASATLRARDTPASPTLAAQRSPATARWTPGAVEQEHMRNTVRLQGSAYGGLGALQGSVRVMKPVRMAGPVIIPPPTHPSPQAAPTPSPVAALAAVGATPDTRATPSGAADRTPAVGAGGGVTVDAVLEWVRRGKVRAVKEAVSGGTLVGGVDAQDSRGDTVLMEACGEGREDLVQWLVLTGGACVTLANNLGDTALHRCFSAPSASTPGPMGGRYGGRGVFSGSGGLSRAAVKLGKWLESMGADMQAANDAGKTPLHALMG